MKSYETQKESALQALSANGDFRKSNDIVNEAFQKVGAEENFRGGDSQAEFIGCKASLLLLEQV